MKKFAKLFLCLTLVVCTCFIVGYSTTGIITKLTATSSSSTSSTKTTIEALPENVYIPVTDNSSNTNKNQTVVTDSASSNFSDLTNPNSPNYIDAAQFENFNLNLNIQVEKSKNVDLDINIKAQIEKTESGLPNILAEVSCDIITSNIKSNIVVNVYIKNNICYFNALGSKYSFNLNKIVNSANELVNYVLNYVKDFDLTKEINKAIENVKNNPEYLQLKNDIYNNTKSFVVTVPTILNDNVVNTVVVTLKDNKFCTFNYTNLVSKKVLVKLDMSLNDSAINFPSLTGYTSLCD